MTAESFELDILLGQAALRIGSNLPRDVQEKLFEEAAAL